MSLVWLFPTSPTHFSLPSGCTTEILAYGFDNCLLFSDFLKSRSSCAYWAYV